MEPIDHPVSRYALDVVEGRETAGELVRLACLRHLTDLETGRDRGLWFDCRAASRVLNFAELIQHTTGPLAGRPLTLRPWQAFRHGSVFGWKKEGGLRRFRTTYHQVAKKNGKTTDTAVPALFTALFDREAAPQGYCAATTRDQAGLLFRELKRMIRASPHLSALMQVWRTSIEVPATEGLIACLSRDGNSSDGINPHFAARDEVHRWTDRELAEVLTNSMIARAQPIDWAITTAGADRASLCGEMRDYAEEVVRGTVSDDSFFAYVAELRDLGRDAGQGADPARAARAPAHLLQPRLRRRRAARLGRDLRRRHRRFGADGGARHSRSAKSGPSAHAGPFFRQTIPRGAPAFSSVMLAGALGDRTPQSAPGLLSNIRNCAHLRPQHFTEGDGDPCNCTAAV